MGAKCCLSGSTVRMTMHLFTSGDVRVVKEFDSKSNGHCPHRFESCSPRSIFAFCLKALFLKQRHQLEQQPEPESSGLFTFGVQNIAKQQYSMTLFCFGCSTSPLAYTLHLNKRKPSSLFASYWNRTSGLLFTRQTLCP